MEKANPNDNAATAEADQIGIANAAYEPIAAFAQWAAIAIDAARWDAHEKLLRSHGDLTQELLVRARAVAKRAAAIDTGALEGLYDIDRGLTITIATQSAMWEVAFQKEDEKVRAFIECQLQAYDFVIDFATKQVPLVEAWIRNLHETLCAAQKTYKAVTAAGVKDQQLVLGAYKEFPNHVRLSSGEIHSYAPVDSTQPEMHRLCNEISAASFQSAHPVLQAAYVHHSFTRIHPFQDGNGRVARALASVFLYRAQSIPFLVLVEHRDMYFDALELADKQDFQAFTDFVMNRCVDAFLLVNESIKAALRPSPLEAAESLNRMFYTRGGYTHQEVDLAGKAIFDLFRDQVALQANALRRDGQLQISLSTVSSAMPAPPAGFRNLVSIQNNFCQVGMVATGPVQVALSWNFFVQVPINSDKYDSIVIRSAQSSDECRIPMVNATAKTKTVAQLQLSMFAQQVMGAAISQLSKQTNEKLHGMGY